jgi:hypothetical protein
MTPKNNDERQNPPVGCSPLLDPCDVEHLLKACTSLKARSYKVAELRPAQEWQQQEQTPVGGDGQSTQAEAAHPMMDSTNKYPSSHHALEHCQQPCGS